MIGIRKSGRRIPLSVPHRSSRAIIQPALMSCVGSLVFEWVSAESSQVLRRLVISWEISLQGRSWKFLSSVVIVDLVRDLISEEI